ncbi:MAG: hypothetical protein LAP40_12935 [Acidobacteriia bacterium]|nr:hypothetical protein [Terriglobia bacterium]
MRYRLVAAIFVVALAASAQSLSVAELRSFLRSSIQIKQSDKEVAEYLSKAKLTEKLDDRGIEDLQALGIGPRTLAALRVLRDRSQSLAAAAPPVAEAAAKPIPPPSSEEQAAILSEVREYALNYSKTLPDFICTQVTRRYAAGTPGGRYGRRGESDPSWQLQDTLTIRLSYFEQKEDYKLILVNNTVTQQDYTKLDGAVSTGEFGSMMREIFEPSTEARFTWDHWATLRGRAALAFAYHVEQERSQWMIDYERKQHIIPAYDGLVYVDRETHQVLRVTMAARGIPSSFPIQQAESVLDYDFQTLSGQRFLLPLKADSRLKTSDVLSRLDEEFRVYRKYSAESEIKYDTPDALPDSQTKEQGPK